ncbi:MAG: glycosyltransferase family 4 protein [Phycisphaerales bacterium]|nr:MAG: glycosyltransferase family 4 protein [Phycisphaerales bacterium]
MVIWLVNPFDPLPGDPEQEGRYATLARLLVSGGHDVTWWTSSFSHRFKKPVDRPAIAAACKAVGIGVRFLSVGPYHRNVGPARLWNHYVLARRFSKAAHTEASRPDIVLASVPPPMLARQAAILAAECGAKMIVDVQDLWPETFYRLGPGVLRPLLPALFWLWHRAARHAYKSAEAVVGVADAYVDRAVELGGPKAITGTIPLGIDLAAFDIAAAEGRCEQFTRPANEIWFAYTGSLNRSYDCLTLVRAFAKIHKTLPAPARLFVTGRGELREKLEEIIRQQGLTNVTLTGFLDFDRWAYLLNQCDAGFNASFPEAKIYLPNKIFYYLAGSVAVLNTIGGQCSRIVREGHCGLDYQAGDVDSCAGAIRQIAGDRKELAALQLNSRRLAETTYDRSVLYRRYVSLIEQAVQNSVG